MRVTVATTVDRDEAHVLLALLRSGGIDAELIGVVDAARIGVGEGALPLRLEVEQEDEAAARELIAAPRAPAPQEDEGPAPLARKRPIIALGVPLVWPGLAHLYASRPFTGGALAVGAVIAILGGQLGAALPLLMIFDAFFGRRAVLAFNRGQHLSPARQLAAGVALVLVALGLVGARPALTWLEQRERRAALSSISFTCTADEATFTNVGAEARDLEVVSVEAAPQVLSLLGEDVPGELVAVGARQLLRTGEAIHLPIRRQLTLFPSARRAFRAELVVRREITEPGVRGVAWCDPAP